MPVGRSVAGRRAAGDRSGRVGGRARVKSIMHLQKAQKVAKNYAAKFRKTCQQVVARKGAAADN